MYIEFLKKNDREDFYNYSGTNHYFKGRIMLLRGVHHCQGAYPNHLSRSLRFELYVQYLPTPPPAFNTIP